MNVLQNNISRWVLHNSLLKKAQMQGATEAITAVYGLVNLWMIDRFKRSLRTKKRALTLRLTPELLPGLIHGFWHAS